MSGRFETDFVDAGVPQMIDELAQEVTYHRIANGQEASGFPLTIDAICEDIESAREGYSDELVSDGRQMVASVALTDVTPQIETDSIEVDGEEWTVMELLGQSHGMARVRTESMGIVRRGGREISR